MSLGRLVLGLIFSLFAAGTMAQERPPYGTEIGLDLAKKIAAAIRHSSGGFRYVKAAGFMLEDRGIVQVSMNLTNYEKTPIFRVFETVKREAERYGVSILESEIVGLVPAAALNAAAEFYLQIGGFKPEQILENKLRT